MPIDDGLAYTPQAQEYVAFLADHADPGGSTESVRELMRALSREFAGSPEAVEVADWVDAGGVPARIYLPRGDERAILVWLHGGGWSAGDPDSYDVLARAIALRAGCGVLSVAYRRVPEHPFPAAIDDAWTAVQWASERWENLAVGGDSAGGNLAAAVALRARDVDLPLRLQVLIYPALDSDLDAAYRDEFVRLYEHFDHQRDFVESARLGMHYLWSAYVPHPDLRALPDASPMQAPDLMGVAPALMLTAQHDFLRPESEEYARRLRADGVPVETVDYAGQVHGFAHLLGLTDDARDATARVAAALRAAFAPAVGS